MFEVIKISLTPELDNQFRNLKRWADSSPDQFSDSGSSALEGVEVEVIEVVDDGPFVCSPTQPFTPLAQQPDLVIDLPDPDIDYDPPPEELENPEMANLLSSSAAISTAVETSPNKRQKSDWNGSVLHNAMTSSCSSASAVLPPPLPSFAASAAPPVPSETSGLAAAAACPPPVPTTPTSAPMTNEGLAALIAGLSIQCQQLQTSLVHRVDSMQFHVDARFDDSNGQTRQLRQEFEGFKASAVSKADLGQEVARQCAAAIALASDAAAAAAAATKIDLANEVAKQCALAAASAAPVAPRSRIDLGPGVHALGRAHAIASDIPPLRSEFVSDRLFIRGWAPFSKNRDQRAGGLSEKACLEISQSLLSKLPLAEQLKVERQSAPMFRNHQVTWFLKFGVVDRKSAWDLRHAISAVIEKEQLKVQDMDIFAALIQEPWKQERNSGLARAAELFIQNAPPGHTVQKDWPSGTLYLTSPSELIIGSWTKGKWEWSSQNLSACGVSLEAVSLSMNI